MDNIITDNYSIFNCCCLEGLEKLKEEKIKVQLVITSPPYFNIKDYVFYNNYDEYLLFLTKVFTLILDITDEGRMCCVNISNIIIKRESRNSESSRIPLAFHFVNLMEKIGWKFIEDIIWLKPEGSAKNRNGSFYQHRQPVSYKPNIINEYIFIFQKPANFLIDKIIQKYDPITSLNSKIDENYERTNIWKINPDCKTNHPAPFPELLALNLIKYYSFTGDLILDPFMGSGTTNMCAYQLFRKSVGFEIHKDYLLLFKERISKVIRKEDCQITEITINKNDYLNLTEIEIKEKLAGLPKKQLLFLAKKKNKNKKELIEIIYNYKLF